MFATIELFIGRLFTIDCFRRDDACDDRPAADLGLNDRQRSRVRGASRRLGLSDRQKREIAGRVAELSSLIEELRRELREKQLRLMVLRPDGADFVAESARLSNQIGVLATQIALTSNKLKTDVYFSLTPSQRATLRELVSALTASRPTVL